MATITTCFPTHWTLADLQQHLGGISLSRIRLYPPPGLATQKHVLDLDDHKDRLCELVDGVLVEKTMGYYESRLAMLLGYFLQSFLEKHDLGIVLGEAGTLEILPGQVRMPDVCFISWERFANRQLPREPIPELAPDLAVEVLSESNTEQEMQRKLREYFAAGTRLVWYVDARSRTVKVYTAPGDFVVLGRDDTLGGGKVLPGFRLPLQELFDRAGRSPSS